MNTITTPEEASRVINALGGTVKVSQLCNISTGAVSQWRTKGIPPARMQFFKLLRSDIFQTKGTT